VNGGGIGEHCRSVVSPDSWDSVPAGWCGGWGCSGGSCAVLSECGSTGTLLRGGNLSAPESTISLNGGCGEMAGVGETDEFWVVKKKLTPKYPEIFGSEGRFSTSIEPSGNPPPHFQKILRPYIFFEKCTFPGTLFFFESFA